MNKKGMHRIFIKLIVVIGFCSSISFSASVDLKIFTVGQANFTLIINGNRALVFDCGYGTGCKKADWIDATEEFTTVKKNTLSKLLNGVTHVTAVISHKHKDHYNLLEPLKKLTNSLNVKRNSAGESGLELSIINGYDDTLSNLKIDSLGTGILIIPLIADIQGASATIHDKCLVLKMIIEEAVVKRSILLTGDASGKSCQAMSADLSLLQNIDVLMLSHHGSSMENALDWFTKVDAGCTDRPLLSIISSNPAGKEGIPTYDTAVRLLNHTSERRILSLQTEGTYFCSYHNLNCYHDESENVVDLPAFSPTEGAVLPIFITSKSAENDGDGIYRISVDREGTISMKNNASATNYQYIFNPDMPDVFRPILLTNLVDQINKAKLFQTNIRTDSERGLSTICGGQTAMQLQTARADYVAKSSTMEQYFATVAPLQDALPVEQKEEKRLKVVIEFANSMLQYADKSLKGLKESFDSLPEDINVSWKKIFYEWFAGDYLDPSKLEQLLPFYAGQNSINIPATNLFLHKILPQLTPLDPVDRAARLKFSDCSNQCAWNTFILSQGFLVGNDKEISFLNLHSHMVRLE